jgi:hypothetical protein
MSRAETRAPNARRNFYEIVLEGNPEHNRGLLIGLLRGSGIDGTLYFSYEEGVSCSIGEKLRGMVGHAAVHAIVDSPLRDLLKRHQKYFQTECGSSIVDDKRIRSAQFEFQYHAYARRYGKEIQELIKSLPRGLKIEGGKPQETLDKGAKGIEAYSPAHHYEVEGEGTIGGRIDHVIEARKRLDHHPLVQVGAIELQLA